MGSATTTGPACWRIVRAARITLLTPGLLAVACWCGGGAPHPAWRWGRHPRVLPPAGLRPAAAVPFPAAAARVGGENRLALRAADGWPLRSVAFEALELADLPGSAERGLASARPLDAPRRAALAGFRVVAGSRSTTRFVTAGPAPDPGVVLTRLNSGPGEGRRDASRLPLGLGRG